MSADPLDYAALAEEIAPRLAPLLAPPDDRPLLSQREVADRLGVSTRTVRDIVARGELPAVRVTDGAPRWRPGVVESFIAARESAAAPDEL